MGLQRPGERLAEPEFANLESLIQSGLLRLDLIRCKQRLELLGGLARARTQLVIVVLDGVLGFERRLIVLPEFFHGRARLGVRLAQGFEHGGRHLQAGHEGFPDYVAYSDGLESENMLAISGARPDLHLRELLFDDLSSSD